MTTLINNVMAFLSSSQQPSMNSTVSNVFSYYQTIGADMGTFYRYASDFDHLKLSNLLFSNKGELKLCDFGLARIFGEPHRPMTPKVVTLWYRAPELLMGCKDYTIAVDLWSVGCIFGELLQTAPIMPGKTDIEQLQLMCRLLGTPNEKIWYFSFIFF